MIWLPSRSGRIDSSSSCSGEPVDAVQLVVGASQSLGLAAVAGGAVGPRQDVETGELGAGVAHVATHR